MVQLQPLMGARETEICVIRGRNIDRSGPVWWYVLDPNELSEDGRPCNLHETARVPSKGIRSQMKRFILSWSDLICMSILHRW